MPVAFSRTLQSLQADGSHHRALLLSGAMLLLAGWLGWFVLGRVTLYEVTEAARLEVRSAVHPIASPVGGRVVAHALVIDREVREGEVLVELDGAAAQLALDEAAAHLADLEARRVALLAELAAQRRTADAHRGSREYVAREAEARVAEADARARLLTRDAERLEALGGSGGMSERDLARGRADADAAEAAALAARLAAARLPQEHLVEEGDRRTRLAELERQRVELEGRAAVEAAVIQRLRRDLEERSVRAPVTGRVGATAGIQTGSVVAVGETLGSIVPAGELRVVALFPVEALGRIQRGQRARLRLEGFPWTRYGSLAATVEQVGSEAREGRFRVELALDPDPAARIPLGHGLAGTVEVEVERVSPAVLGLRLAGDLLQPSNRTPPQAAWKNSP
jgi:multidrug resistance efflux pump